MVDAKAILAAVLDGYADDNKWIGSRFEAIKRLSNTKVGTVGQDFVEGLCDELNFEAELPVGRSPQSPWDIRIEGVTFELKTATEDVNGSFQFNHIRYHRKYQGLLCVGIGPDDIGFDAWSKADVTTGAAGHLVSMDQGSSATWKLTKRSGALRPIADFESHLLNLIVQIEQGGTP
ncbi:hypothetical protein [Candidatus Poriferisocius sp.]|uniref:hypothetical protein n=1 Tax=Candidatus Poriferisocius sp. TaxID=3101276 RepID=UPI003B021F7A